MSESFIGPQRGPQEEFLASTADITIYGGAAGGGKSYGLLLSPLHYIGVKNFGCTIFRKNHNQIFAEGGLWDEATEIYSRIPQAEMQKSSSQWVFKDENGRILSKIAFAHIESERDLPGWQGSQICEMDFDELTHFSEKVFFYMLARNRSTCGVRPYIRATCNPDADSWVARFVEWWIDPQTGYPIPERSGKKRWMIRRNEQIFWADKKKELIEQFHLTTREELTEPKSVTFIASSIYDNQELLRVDPSYLANLKALAEVDRERLLNGNWKIRPAAGLYFKREQVGNILEIVPGDVMQWVRCWDLAATDEGDDGEAAYTAGVLIGKRKNGRYIIADVINRQLQANDVRKIIKLTGQQDNAKFKHVRIRLPQDPGQAGKDQAQIYTKFLSGFDVTTVLETGSKIARATPFAAQWQAGNVDILYGEWNDAYLNQLESFPDGKYKDMVDASANGFAEVELKTQFNLSNLI